MGNERIPDVIEKVSFPISQLKDSLSKSSRTSRLKINYMNYINIAKPFIRAERTGNCHLHLTTVVNMKKSARLILQTMQVVPKQYLWLYIKFAEDGCHSICPGSRCGVGIWTDLVIEQEVSQEEGE